VLVGHSIGGMIALTYCRLFADRLRERVAGVVLLNTTYTNPVRTTSFSGFFGAIQKPVLEPLMHLVTWVSPLIWALNWLSYQNGTAHVVSRSTGFAGAQTRGQVDFATWLSVRPAPATLARGVLAMFRYDATDVLPALDLPALVITGNRDRILVPEASAFMHDALPHARLVTLAPAGHMSVFEQHGELAAALDGFAGHVHAIQQATRAA
jgi:pimeloyl-ACP methyl ester carboxylesterase